MSKKAFDKIAAGLNEALDAAKPSSGCGSCDDVNKWEWCSNCPQRDAYIKACVEEMRRPER